MRHTDRGSLRGVAAPLIALTLMLGACAGGAAEPAGGSAPAATDGNLPGGGASPTPASDPGTNVPPAAPGEAVVVVEGKTLTFTILSCAMSPVGGFTFNAIAANGISDIKGMGVRSQGSWIGSIDVVLSGADEEHGGGSYLAELDGEGRTIVIEDQRLSYAGPLSFEPPSTGNAPISRPAGEGTIAVTCS